MYEEHFGLSRKPFQLSPDARFFYPSAEHQRALSFLQYGISQADGFIVITGNVGTGKTTLVQTLLDQLDDEELTIGNIVTPNLDESELLQVVADSFGIDATNTSKSKLLKSIEYFLVQQAKANRRVLLIVDEAQNIPSASVEELRMLSNFQLDGSPTLQIFLLGQQEFRTTLLSDGFEQLRQRIIATYHLNPLDPDETKTYIEHRLSVAEWEGNPSITDDAYQAIHTFSDGVPRRINNLCDRLLLFAFLEEIESIDESTVNQVSKEIGTEFFGDVERPDSDLQRMRPKTAEVFDTPESPTDAMARSVFDKADAQLRLAALERAVDALGHKINPEIVEIREELSFVRLMLDDLLHEVRQLTRSKTGKRRA
ncbi:MAG: XrtA/PEP-CTERM system-associated ATPase [Pseudomonadota bacterium]